MLLSDILTKNKLGQDQAILLADDADLEHLKIYEQSTI